MCCAVARCEVLMMLTENADDMKGAASGGGEFSSVRRKSNGVDGWRAFYAFNFFSALAWASLDLRVLSRPLRSRSRR